MLFSNEEEWIYDVLRPKTYRPVDRYHVLPPSVDTGHLPNLFIKDAIIKRSATSIVLSFLKIDRSI
jgi:hypothetical protein